MMRVAIERAGENAALAEAEARSVVELLGGGMLGADERGRLPGRWVEADLRERADAIALTTRLALSHSVCAQLAQGPLDDLEHRFSAEAGRMGGTARFDWLGPAPPTAAEMIRRLATAFRAQGGRIRLVNPDRRFLVSEGPSGTFDLWERLPGSGRKEAEGRRMPTLPFQRPVSLRPRLARAAANLAGAGPGARVADPFVGTGALLLEAGLLGARLFGSDLDPDMIRGAARNLGTFGLAADALRVADASEAAKDLPWDEVDAVLTDPPYGRASSSRGEAPEELVRRALPRWADRVRAGGRLVVIGPAIAWDLPAPWVRRYAIPDRVHRSLTRVFEMWQKGTVTAQ
jgi:tRNA (guanine10-N2)-dimethyltransferase